MSGSTSESLLERAREAASRSDWRQAHAALAEADARSTLGGSELVFFAGVAYAAGHLDVTIEAWERAHADSLRSGDEVGAAGAAVRVAMHLLFDTALMAPVRGWLSRAERLLDGKPDCQAHAWLAVVRSYERLLAGDFPSSRRWARRAIEVGSTCDKAAAAIGRVAEARALVLGGGTEGDVRQGMRLLEEAGVAAVSGEIDPLSTGVVYCELVCALQSLAQYDLAEEWTEAMERWRRSAGVGSIHGRCRVHRAEILRLRGALDEAEKQALQACEELRPYLRRELGWPLNELGRIRLQRGDVRGAEEAFLSAHQLGWDPEPGLALVRLARGDTAQAVASIREALEHPLNVPSKELPPNNELRRAPLLVAQVEIELAGGHRHRARAAAQELERVAAKFESKALIASAALARGRVKLADGDAAGARHDLESAARLWNEVGAPYETALARSILEGGPATSHPPAAPRSPDETAAPRLDVFRREGDSWSIAFDGRLVRLRDLKGLRYLARLLQDPGREFHVLDLVALESGEAMPVSRDLGGMLDTRAKAAYRRRLAEIEADIDEANATGDAERATRAELERDFLVRELSRAVGLGGRDRVAGSASERARASVTRAVRQAMARIREHEPRLAQHLDRTVRTGTYCAYLPDPRVPVAWNRG